MVCSLAELLFWSQNLQRGKVLTDLAAETEDALRNNAGGGRNPSPSHPSPNKPFPLVLLQTRSVELPLGIISGQNKMVINHLEKLFVTNDAATILRELEVMFLFSIFCEWIHTELGSCLQFQQLVCRWCCWLVSFAVAGGASCSKDDGLGQSAAGTRMRRRHQFHYHFQRSPPWTRRGPCQNGKEPFLFFIAQKAERWSALLFEDPSMSSWTWDGVHELGLEGSVPLKRLAIQLYCQSHPAKCLISFVCS